MTCLSFIKICYKKNCFNYSFQIYFINKNFIKIINNLLQMQHIYLSNDETMKDKYVNKNSKNFLNILRKFSFRLILVKFQSVIFFVILYQILIQCIQHIVIKLQRYYQFLLYLLYLFDKLQCQIN
jgi:hypothetical protein